MRRDLVVTALIFALIGFLGGYIYIRQTRLPPERGSGASTGSLALEAPAAEEASGLPEGHPPLDVARQIVDLRKDAEKNPTDPAAALRLADFLFNTGRFQDAIPWYERALRLEPKNIDARIRLAGCLVETAQHDAALKQLDTVLQLKPNEPHALYHQAVTLLRGKQDRAGAERVYRQLRQVNPHFPGLEDLERLFGEPPRGGRAGTGGR